MRWVVLVIIAAAESLVLAKPLPKGLVVSLKNDNLYATRIGVTVPLRGPDAAIDQFTDFKGAELSVDGATILVHVSSCGGVPDEPLEIGLAPVEARLENSIGMGAHLKKKYPDAIAHFAIAAQMDPSTPVYATNLLSAQSMGGKLDDADKTIAALAKTNTPWLAWRLQVDSELAAVKSRASAKQVFAPERSMLTFAKLGDSIATNPSGLIAKSEWQAWGGPGAPGGTDLVIYDASGQNLLRLTVVALGDACTDGTDSPAPCSKANKVHIAANTRVADALLGALGFVKLDTVWPESTDDSHYATADQKLVIELDDKASTIKVVRGKTATTVRPLGYGAPKRVGLAGSLLVLQYRDVFAACDGDAQRSSTQFLRVK